jgi:poly-gamma-glutamate capsule biosynthesis protein CapA/YwtB (metallophosphatase superfamily)
MRTRHSRPARTSRSTRRPKPRDLVVAIASDWAPIRTFAPIIEGQPEAVYGDVLPVLRSADLRIVNNECALTRHETPVWKSGAVFKGLPSHVAGLTAVPFDVACLGNNHVLDYGERGLRDTLAVLHRNGIRTVGAGMNAADTYAPLTMTVAGRTVHVVNVCEGEDQTASTGGAGVFGWDIQRAVDTIEQCKAAGGVVLVIAHCGLEYVPFAPPYVVEAFRAMADAGADAVIGHHPHVPQGVEWRGRTPIIYSLGNFVFYQHTDLHFRKIGFCVTLDIGPDGVRHADLHPYRIQDDGLHALDVRESTAFHQVMARLSKPYQTPTGHEKAWDAYLEYYGVAGFAAEVSGILEKMRTDPRKGAAMFRNRVTTMQHIELWRTYLTRVMSGGKPRYSKETYALVADYFTRQAAPAAG